MRRIHKQREPDCLADARRGAKSTGSMTTGAAWEQLGSACKAEIRQALAQEQLGLCAYCTRRLDPSKGARDDAPRRGGMKIEHWRPRSVEPSRTFTWANLLGVCGGIVLDERGASQSICDKARGDRSLHLHPAQHEVHELLGYTARGELRSADERATHDVEILALNDPTLRANRAKVWAAQGKALRRSDAGRTLRHMLALARTPGRDGRLPPFAPVIEYYARRKLKQRGLSP